MVRHVQGSGANALFLGANIPGKPAEFNVYMGGADVFFKKCEAIPAGGFKSLHGQKDA